jgi:rod shape-determining protein MreC
MSVSGRDRRRRYSLALIVLTCITLITLDRRADDRGPLGVVGRVAHRIVSPISAAVDSVFDPVGEWLAGVFDGGELRRQNEALRAEVAELQGQIRESDRALAENEEFRKFFGLVWLGDIPTVGATVVADAPPGNFEKTVELNRGSEAGIKVGYAVIVPNGLAGRVVEAWQGGSKVLLITDPTFGVSVRLQDQRIRGPAEGQPGSSTLKLNLSSADLSREQQESIVVGDPVDTCGCDDSEYPPGVPVGSVVRKEQQTSGIALIVRVRPYLDVASLEHVVVLLWEPGDPVPPPPSTTLPSIPSTASTATTARGEPTATVPQGGGVGSGEA